MNYKAPKVIGPTREELLSMTAEDRKHQEQLNADTKVKMRTFLEHNYHAIFFNGKTYRFEIIPDKGITELKYPEFYDIKITAKCTHGQCEWCYQDSTPNDSHYTNIIEKIEKFFGEMSFNERPFQVAIGGGEPTESPEFEDVLRWFKTHGITPNYTTNGTNLTESVLIATEKYCGGVAISCHSHLDSQWRSAVNQFIPIRNKRPDFRVNLHNIISDKKSIDEFIEIYQQLGTTIDFFVLLPLVKQGRGLLLNKEVDLDYLELAFTELIKNTKKIPQNVAFGVKFDNWLRKPSIRKLLPVSLYEPESMSKFLDMKDTTIYPSSFDH